MFYTLSVLNKVIPKEIESLMRRYAILKNIQLFQPVGRRMLATKLHIGEKLVRSDTDFFREENYLEVTAAGMMLTDSGLLLLEELKAIMKEMEGIQTLEEALRTRLGVKDLIIVSGDTDQDLESLNNIGRAAAKYLQDLIKEDSIVALTGGHTVKSVVRYVKETPQSKKGSLMKALIVPARGSLGNNVETQANTLVEELAKKLHCAYLLLNLPDNLSAKAIEGVVKDPNIKKTIQEIKKANIIVFGVGNAQKMAYRRDLHTKVIDILNEKNAVAEALGYYFNESGEMVYDSKTIGFHLEEFEKSIYPIAVAGGRSKARAILAVRKFVQNGCLIIDEACATHVMELLP